MKTTKTKKDGWIILGASSPLARAFALHVANGRNNFILIGRDMENLQHISADLVIRTGSHSQILFGDASDTQSHDAIVKKCETMMREVNFHIFCAIGIMPSQSTIDQSDTALLDTIFSNSNGVISLLHRFAALLEKMKGGSMTVLSSVAGDRGKPSNYVYGAAKASLSVYLEGLRGRLHKSSIPVLTVKPGPIDSSMTWNLKTLFPPASPDRLARSIHRSWLRKRDVLYYPSYWRFIMMILRSLPEFILKRLDF